MGRRGLQRFLNSMYTSQLVHEVESLPSGQFRS